MAAAVVGVIAIAFFGKRLKKFFLRVPGAEVSAEGYAETNPGDAINRNVVSTAGKVESRNEAGGHAINDTVRAKGNVTSIATPPRGTNPKA